MLRDIVRTWTDTGQRQQESWLRCVDGRPVSALTTQFLDWCCAQLQASGKTALLVVWDNASWHGSAKVRTWIRAHNQQVKRTGIGVRIVTCPLPIAEQEPLAQPDRDRTQRAESAMPGPPCPRRGDAPGRG